MYIRLRQAATYDHILIKDLDDDLRRVLRDVLWGAVEGELVEYERLVPHGTQSLLLQLGQLRLGSKAHRRVWICVPENTGSSQHHARSSHGSGTDISYHFN